MQNEIMEYNNRQINLMIKKIIFFKAGQLDIYDLISDLGGLLNSIQDCNKDWFAAFQSQLGTLDTIFANIVYENRTEFTELEKSLIDKSLQVIDGLITTYKKNNFVDEDV